MKNGKVNRRGRSEQRPSLRTKQDLRRTADQFRSDKLILPHAREIKHRSNRALLTDVLSRFAPTSVAAEPIDAMFKARMSARIDKAAVIAHWMRLVEVRVRLDFSHQLAEHSDGTYFIEGVQLVAPCRRPNWKREHGSNRHVPSQKSSRKLSPTVRIFVDPITRRSASLASTDEKAFPSGAGFVIYDELNASFSRDQLARRHLTRILRKIDVWIRVAGTDLSGALRRETVRFDSVGPRPTVSTQVVLIKNSPLVAFHKDNYRAEPRSIE